MKNICLTSPLFTDTACTACVVENKKTLALVQDVDVVVVGGSSGAVAAAIKAAEAGAKVFVVAPRPYLGEDMAGKLRLHLDAEDDTRCALLKTMFTPIVQCSAKLPFTCQTNQPAAAAHRDVSDTMLANGKWSAAPKQIVRFGSDVSFELDLGAVFELGSFVASVFQRDDTWRFVTGAIRVEGSVDKTTWKTAGETIDFVNEEIFECATMTVPLRGKYRYLKIVPQIGESTSRQLFGEFLVYPAQHTSTGAGMANQTTPLKIKKTLDEALIKARIPFLTGAPVTATLCDADNKLAGVVISNRSGRQAIKAKVVIDATERGLSARAAGGEATPFPSNTYTFKRIVVAGERPHAEGMRVKELFGLYDTRITGIQPPKGMPDTIQGRMFECEIDLSMKDGSAQSFAKAEQKARDLTFVPSQMDSADTLSLLPPDHIKGQSSSKTPWPGADTVDLAAFQPANTAYLFVLSAMADLSRDSVAQMLKPGNLMAVGERIGSAAAKAAAQRPALHGVRLAGGGLAKNAHPAKINEHNKALPLYLCNTAGTVPADACALPVLAECDVFVAGAGTGGGPAGIAAVRQGAKTIICDYLYQMGGVQTDGLIGRYWYGNRVGFTTEIDQGVKDTGVVLSQCKSEWYRSQNRKAGAEIWYGTMVTGIMIANNHVTGVVVVTPDGTRGVIRCKIAIDGTGNAELAAMAGEQTEFITADELALQGAGQTPRTMGASYTNTDIGFVDDTDAADLCFFALRSRISMHEGIWDQAQVINSRERRRLVGMFCISPLDVVNKRTYPDVITQTASNFDSHGYTVHEQFFIENPGHHRMMVNLPLRCLLPKQLEGLLVLGLGISAHRDAMPILRMQPDVQNQGYAAGVAAAMSIKAGVTVRKVDIHSLQKHLIEKEILPPAVLAMQDSFPLSQVSFVAAVKTLPENYQGLSIVLTDAARSIPLLQNAYAMASTPEAKFIYAHVLGIMGCADGEKILIEKVRSLEWDKGWNFRGMGQFNRSVSWMDSYIIALGRACSKTAVPMLIEKAKALCSTSEFSHFRAVAMALEAINDRSSAAVLADLLAQEGIGGHSFTMQPDIPAIKNYASIEGDRERSDCLRELSLARALYRLGDYEGRGEKTLRSYATDPRGAYAMHAKLVLDLEYDANRR